MLISKREEAAWTSRRYQRRKLYCSFLREEPEGSRNHCGTTAYICNECIEPGNEIIADETPKRACSRSGIRRYQPLQIKKFLDEYVIGQVRAKKILSVAAHNHYKKSRSERVSNGGKRNSTSRFRRAIS
jgi:ATP-dependent Clp protease ATP-binding subunit ClpX